MAKQHTIRIIPKTKAKAPTWANSLVGLAVILVVAVFVLVIWLIVRQPSDPSQGAGNWIKNIGKQIKKGCG